MDIKEEYHDPDYPENTVSVKLEPVAVSEDDKIDKIKKIIGREFTNEIDMRENEIMLIEQRMTTSRRLLHRLRYSIVNSYYNELKLQLTNGHIQDELAAQRDPRSKAEVWKREDADIKAEMIMKDFFEKMKKEYLRLTISSLLREGQREIHPSVKKLLGKKTVDLSEIFKTRAPRNKVRKDYSAMLQKRNYTICADSTKSLRPDVKSEPEAEPCSSQPKKVPRHIEPKITNVVTLDESTRNQMKHRYRIIIGNTSKYAPGASSADRSTHKWLLYVRGPPDAPDLSRLVRAVTVRLHHSYAPHHTVVLHKPPFHIARRGWGEFPARIELEFALPHRNRPALVHHTIKLDTGCTGVQTLGSETVVDVWLYSTPEMLEYEFKEDNPSDSKLSSSDQQISESPIRPKLEPVELEDSDSQNENWLEFFSKEPKQLDVDEMIIKTEKKIDEKTDLDNVIESNIISRVTELDQHWPNVDKHDSSNEKSAQQILPKRIVKYIDPSTGKLYYLEMDRKLDLSKVQEIIINNTTAKISPFKGNGLKSVRKKKGVSLLKPEVKSLLKTEVMQKVECINNFTHIENDHCYLATPNRYSQFSENDARVEIVKESSLYEHLCSVTYRFDSIRAGVNYMLNRIPVISDQVQDTVFSKHFPFVVENQEKYWKMDFAKRRNIEWSRAKLINRILTEHFIHSETVWRTKQILVYARLHGYYPVRNELMNLTLEDHNWSSSQELDFRRMETNIKEYYPRASHIKTISVFRPEDYTESVSEVMNLTESDDEVDIEGTRSPVRVRKESVNEGSYTILPVDDEDERLRFLYLEKKCTDIGIELRCEDVGNGFYYSASHSVMLCAVRSFATELVRTALAHKLMMDSHTPATVWTGSSSSKTEISLEHVLMAMSNPRLQLLTGKDIGAERQHKQTYL